MDFDGAIEAFEKALEVNPRSASAHLELGVLYEKDNRDCAAAIYHFKRYLELMSTNVPNAGMISDHILACKQVLARDVMLGPGAQNAQQELQRLTEENQRLRDENQKWRSSNAIRPQDSSAESNSLPASNVTARTENGSTPATRANQSNPATGTAPAVSHAPPNPARAYKVQSGDTMAAIARKNGLKLSVLMAANPGVEPQKMRAGQILNLPAP